MNIGAVPRNAVKSSFLWSVHNSFNPFANKIIDNKFYACSYGNLIHDGSRSIERIRIVLRQPELCGQRGFNLYSQSWPLNIRIRRIMHEIKSDIPGNIVDG